ALTSRTFDLNSARNGSPFGCRIRNYFGRKQRCRPSGDSRQAMARKRRICVTRMARNRFKLSRHISGKTASMENFPNSKEAMLDMARHSLSPEVVWLVTRSAKGTTRLVDPLRQI